MLATRSSFENLAPDALARWLMAGGIDSSKLQIKTLADGQSSLVAACEIKAGENLITLPASHLMSVTLARKSDIANKLSQAGVSGISEQSLLAAYILQERQDNRSFWAPYLNALPQGFSHIPLFFSAAEQEILQGSPVLEMSLTRRFVLQQDYHKLASIDDLNACSFEDYMWARTVINTRSFLLHQDVVLAPYMDFVSHAPKPNSVWGAGKDKASLELECCQDIAPGEKVSICFGHKSNRRFYSSYGLVHDDPNFNCARLTLSLKSGDPLYREKMALLSITSTCIDMDIGAFEPDGFKQAMTFTRVATAKTLQNIISSYHRPTSKAEEMLALQAFLASCQQMLSLEHNQVINPEQGSDSQVNRENWRNCKIIKAQEQQTLHSYILLASSALRILSHGHNLNFLQPEVESSYLAELKALMKKAKEQAQ